ncbi:MAG: T9SS type A sorting domain-containing protein [Bacteroidetes bacterium]|nr:T9SS type A sorting domain-containing protein [Bacteroidota bacterium]
MCVGGVAMLLFSIHSPQTFAQPVLPETMITPLPGITGVHDVVINIGNKILYKKSPNAFYYKPATTTTVKTIGSRTMTGLYPNPAHNKVYLSHAAGKEYRLMDITGKTVLAGQYTTSGVDITTLTCGFYMLNIKDSEGKQTSFKFTKQ